MDLSVSPTYLFSSSGPLTLRKAEFPSASATLTPRTSALRSTSSWATALAIMVLPQPGGPYSSTPALGVIGRGLLPRPLEHQADGPLGLAHVLVQQLGALDVEEGGVPQRLGDAHPAHLGAAQHQFVGDGLGDHGLAAAGRPVQQHA